MEECPICLLQNDLEIFTTECCKKKFHKECYDKCMEYKKECPLCRTPQKVDHIIVNINDNETVVICRIINSMVRIISGVTISFYLASLVLPPHFN
jgi:hypothetical protein